MDNWGKNICDLADDAKSIGSIANTIREILILLENKENVLDFNRFKVGNVNTFQLHAMLMSTKKAKDRIVGWSSALDVLESQLNLEGLNIEKILRVLK